MPARAGHHPILGRTGLRRTGRRGLAPGRSAVARPVPVLPRNGLSAPFVELHDIIPAKEQPMGRPK